MSVTITPDGFIKEALGVYYAADSFGPFASGQPKWLVLHGTAWPNGSAVGIATSWADEVAAGQLGASTHIIIDKDGTYTQGITLLNTAAGNSGAADSPRASYLPTDNLNMYTISVEHCKYATDDSDILTPQQVVTSFALCKAICEFCNIPKSVVTIQDVSQGGIIRHADCDAKYRSHCPGPYPFADLQNYLNGGPEMFSNTLCVEVWSSSPVIPLPKRDTGIFNLWRAEWIAGHFKGVALSPEYAVTLSDGRAGVAQNFAGGTAYWANDGSESGWL
jgi:N-acetylmuramoyl-L-alanine amidase